MIFSGAPKISGARSQDAWGGVLDNAKEFIIEAQIKLGQMLKDMPKNEGQLFRGTERKPRGNTQPPTYTELGINYKDASVWQFIAEHEQEIQAEVQKVI